MKRFLLIMFGAVAASAAVVITNYQKIVSRTSSTTSDATYVAEDETGEAVAAQNKPADPGQRREIAETMKQVSNLAPSEWSRSFELLSSDGKKLSSEELKGQLYVANFFFSTCPSSCKQQTDQVKLLQEKYKDAPVRFVSISVDPEVDTPEQLSAYAVAAGAIPGKWFFLTGDMKAISKAGNEVFLLGITRPKIHPDRLCLVDADGTLAGKYNWHDADEVKALKEHIDELLRNMASADKPTHEGS